jgi:poly(A) polymerase
MKIEFLDNHPVVHEVRQVLADVYIQFGCGPQDAWVVGGAVRNCLMGLPIKDLDFATNAHPDLVQKLFESAGYKPILTGKSFGTIRVIVQGMEVEITTYREQENYNKGSRKPSVVFGTTIQGDLARRDFTLNAMAYSPLRGLCDPFNGQEALSKGRLITPLDPKQTFSDDPLRMLRALRFQATYGFTMTEDVFNAIRENAHRMLYLSAERIKQEMDKLLVGPNVAEAIRGLVATRIANFILPELLPTVGMKQNEQYHHKNVFEHTLSVVESCPATPLMRWAGLLHDIGKPATWQITETGIHFYNHEDLGAKMAEEIAYRFRFSTTEREMLKSLVKYHMRPNLYRSEWKDESVRRLKRECEPFLTELLDLSKADITSMNPVKVEKALGKLQELKERLEKEPEPLKKCPLSGNEIMVRFGIPQGPLVGMVQSYLMKKIESGVSKDDTEKLWELAQRKVEELTNESR